MKVFLKVLMKTLLNIPLLTALWTQLLEAGKFSHRITLGEELWTDDVTGHNWIMPFQYAFFGVRALWLFMVILQLVLKSSHFWGLREY